MHEVPGSNGLLDQLHHDREQHNSPFLLQEMLKHLVDPLRKKKANFIAASSDDWSGQST